MKQKFYSLQDEINAARAAAEKGKLTQVMLDALLPKCAVGVNFDLEASLLKSHKFAGGGELKKFKSLQDEIAAAQALAGKGKLTQQVLDAVLPKCAYPFKYRLEESLLKSHEFNGGR